MSSRSIAPAHRLRFPQIDREIETHGSESVFDSARRNGVRIVGACGGRGTCGTCAVRVDGKVERIGADASADGHHTGKRKWLRACRIVPRSDCAIEIAPRSLAPVARTEVDGGGGPLPLDPLVTSIEVRLAPATLADTRADSDRIIEAVPGAATIDLAAARQLPPLLRRHDWAVRAHRRDEALIGFAPPGSRTLGLAVDLGTTNVAGFLVDLESGISVASLGIENPQTPWGADVISRLNHAIHSAAHAGELRDAAVTAVNALAHDLCQAAGAATTDIVDAVIGGNTAMHHLLLGLPVRQLGRAPFVAALRDSIDVEARELGITLAPGARLHMAPNIGGFVGGDHVTALLATDEHWSHGGTTLVMDIGTNTEISLIHRGDIRSVSCPSGPALEGGHISCGMRAAEGAIERVSLADDGRIVVKAIGKDEPVGLCGSGVIDALATLLSAGILNARGQLAARHPAVTEAHGVRAAVLAPGVLFSQRDVRAVQLAKAAIRTGIDMLLDDTGCRESALDRVVIAGAFGAYIDVASAIAIGLLPDLPLDRFRQVGNAAGLGVRRMLASGAARRRARELARACRYVELSTRADFQKRFIDNIGFNPHPLARIQT